jgi:hypothetical protein
VKQVASAPCWTATGRGGDARKKESGEQAAAHMSELQLSVYGGLNTLFGQTTEKESLINHVM